MEGREGEERRGGLFTVSGFRVFSEWGFRAQEVLLVIFDAPFELSVDVFLVFVLVPCSRNDKTVSPFHFFGYPSHQIVYAEHNTVAGNEEFVLERRFLSIRFSCDVRFAIK